MCAGDSIFNSDVDDHNPLHMNRHASDDNDESDMGSNRGNLLVFLLDGSLMSSRIRGNNHNYGSGKQIFQAQLSPAILQSNHKNRDTEIPIEKVTQKCK